MTKIAVLVHVFYENLWPEMQECIENFETSAGSYDLFVTITCENPYLHNTIMEFNPSAHIFIVENRGYDVGPFMYLINRIDLGRYDYVVKLHTKRDYPFFEINGFIVSNALWRKYLLEFCKTRENVDKTLATFEKDPKIGMIASGKIIKNEYIYHAANLLKELGFEQKGLTYPAGTMFIVRAELLKPIQGKADIEDFEVTKSNKVIVLAHSYERIFGYMINSLGYTVKDFRLKSYGKTKFLRMIRYKIARYIRKFLGLQYKL